jgi:hypothetical protein
VETHTTLLIAIVYITTISCITTAAPRKIRIFTRRTFTRGLLGPGRRHPPSRPSPQWQRGGVVDIHRPRSRVDRPSAVAAHPAQGRPDSAAHRPLAQRTTGARCRRRPRKSVHGTQRSMSPSEKGGKLLTVASEEMITGAVPPLLRSTRRRRIGHRSPTAH